MDLDSDFQSEEPQQDEAIFSQDDGSSSMSAFPDHNSIGSTSGSSVMEQPSLDILTPQTSHSLFQNLGKSPRHRVHV